MIQDLEMQWYISFGRISIFENVTANAAYIDDIDFICCQGCQCV